MPRASLLPAASANSRSSRRSPVREVGMRRGARGRCRRPRRHCGRTRSRAARDSPRASVELTLLDALPAREVVGVDRVAGAVRVVSDPQRRAVRPHAGGPVVAAVEFLDVAGHGPLEVDLARGGATAAAAASSATARDRPAALRPPPPVASTVMIIGRPAGDCDGDLDCRRGVADGRRRRLGPRSRRLPVVGGDRD